MDYQPNQQIENQCEVDQIKSSQQTQQLLQILQESKKFTLTFIDELKEKALTPISQQVLQHYHSEIKPNYYVKDILNITDKRISKMIRNKKIKKNWNFDDIVLLLWFVSKYIDTKQNLTCQNFTNQDWKFISKLIPGSSSKGCMFKFISLKKVKLSLFNWSKEQQNMLRQLVQKFGQNKWKQISQILYENNPTSKTFRTPKQCRQHWNCYLDSRLRKGPWSEDQDIKLLENVRQNKGQRKWSSIKHLFEGRTQNALKNRYNLLLDRQRRVTPNKDENQLIKQYLKSKLSSQMTIDPSPDSLQQQKKLQQIQPLKLRQQIFEQQNQQADKQNEQQGDLQKVKYPQMNIKSQNSSFKISQAYEKNKIQNQKLKKLQNHPDTIKNFMLVGIGTITSIMTNQQGFYTNLIFKPFYGA